MGNLEKFVVVTVLFLVAVVLGVSLHDNEDGEPGGEGDGPIRGLSGDTQAAGPSEELLGGEEQPPLLHSLVDPLRGEELESEEPVGVAPVVEPDVIEVPVEPGPEQPQVSADGHPRILLREDGLVASPLQDYWYYTCRGGDTMRKLSRRFYGTENYTGLLRSANAGQMIGPGVEIWVPVYDFGSDAGVREPHQPVLRGGEELGAELVESGDGDGDLEEVVESQSVALAGGGQHMVVSGDTLTGISKQYYGTITRWMEIFEANRDVLVSPDALRVDQVLRLPPQRH